ncbi:unannotated protein [freshwater metagenome]|uniref:Unannotated protein n=1 Tax=freshwater metagenome TaxID=449393 RepID=A0A6J7DE98_9ZZZZ
MLLALVLASVYFSIVDIRSHRIPNRPLLLFLIFLSILAVATNSNLNWMSAAISLPVGLLLSIVAGLGFGDVKLLMILTLFFLPSNLTSASRFLAGVAISALVLMVATLLKGGNYRDSMAFAPSLFAGAILCASLP